MRFAICNELFEGWEFAKTVDFLAGLGYDAVEIAPFTLAESVGAIGRTERRAIRETASRAGLAIAGLHWLLVKPAGLHLTSPDAATRRRTQAYLRELIDFCAEIGGSTLVFGSPNQRNIVPEIDRETGWRYAVEGFRICGEAAAEKGVTLCLEALPGQMTNLLNTNEEVRAMVDEVAHPNVAMMVDVKSMCAEDIPIPDNIRACRGRIRHVHANDANLKGPGFGEVDFRPIFGALREIGYQGFVSVEVFDFTPDPETIARESLRYMRSCLEG